MQFVQILGMPTTTIIKRNRKFEYFVAKNQPIRVKLKIVTDTKHKKFEQMFEDYLNECTRVQMLYCEPV